MTGGTLEETPSPGLQAGRAQGLKQNRAEKGGSSCRGLGVGHRVALWTAMPGLSLGRTAGGLGVNPSFVQLLKVHSEPCCPGLCVMG